MRKNRFYSPTDLSIGSIVVLADEDAHKIQHVLRLKLDDLVYLFNGHDLEAKAVITAIKKNQIMTRVTHLQQDPRESPITINLAHAISKHTKIELTLQKGVELGVCNFFPLYSDRSFFKQLDQEKECKMMERWQKIIIAACAQCGRNQIPSIHKPTELATWVYQHKEAANTFITSPKVSQTNYTVDNTKPFYLLVGPEGGLTEEEESYAITNQFQPLKLGPRILRTETAALVAVTTMQIQFGDFHQIFSNTK